jgi:hypothetical protein
MLVKHLIAWSLYLQGGEADLAQEVVAVALFPLRLGWCCDMGVSRRVVFFENPQRKCASLY